MAKRPTLPPDMSNIFKKTEPEELPIKPAKPGSKRGRGRPRERAPGSPPSPIGVTLADDELDRLSAMAAEIGVRRHTLMVYALRDFIRRWDEGERPKTRQRTINELDA